MNKEVLGEAGTAEDVSLKDAPFELARPEAARPVVPPLVAPPAGTRDVADRNEIFSRLVQGDTDIAGLVAYSIYKQNKLDWLAAFETAKARVPDDAELFSYIVGEGTPRRLATYRQLAEATLAGDGAADGVGLSRRPGARATRSALTPGLIATYALVALLFVIGFWLAAHFTMGR